MVLDDTYTIDGEASLSTVNFSVLSKCWGCVSWKDPFLEDIVSTQINWLSGWNWSVLGKSDFNNKICLRNWFEKSRLGTPSSYAPNREVAWIEIWPPEQDCAQNVNLNWNYISLAKLYFCEWIWQSSMFLLTQTDLESAHFAKQWELCFVAFWLQKCRIADLQTYRRSKVSKYSPCCWKVWTYKLSLMENINPIEICRKYKSKEDSIEHGCLGTWVRFNIKLEKSGIWIE